VNFADFHGYIIKYLKLQIYINNKYILGEATIFKLLRRRRTRIMGTNVMINPITVLYFIFIALYLLSNLGLFSPPSLSRDYTLSDASANVTVLDNGIIHVEESIKYTFRGEYNEVYRIIHPPSGGSIKHITGYLDGEECEIKSLGHGSYEIVGKLPKPTPEKVNFVLSYEYYGGTKVYNDVSELHYKLWGEEWDRELDSFAATVTLPTENGDDISYWFHPDDYTIEDNKQGDVIYIEADNIPANNWYEIRAVFPRIANPDSELVSIQDQDVLDKIIAYENEYEAKQEQTHPLYLLTVLFAVIAGILPFLIYYKYGREIEIDYSAIYEREPPTPTKPVFVNAMMKGNIGYPTIEGFTATFMDLVYRGYFKIEDTISAKSHLGLINYYDEDVLIKIGDYSESLQDFEYDVFSLIKTHMENDRILWSELEKKLGKDTKFSKFLNEWDKKVKKKIKVEILFDSKGNKYMSAFSIIIILGLFLWIRTITSDFPVDQFPAIRNAFGLSVFVGIYVFLMLIFTSISEKSLGKWTPQGRLFQQRWENFRKYLTDFSALKEHPPGSIEIWDYYMVYAIALGVAEKALENMSLTVPSDQHHNSHFCSMQHHPVFTTGFTSAYNASSPSSGGFGGAGGGCGGGGGGAR
jgi:uncharacterized membrane protein